MYKGEYPASPSAVDTVATWGTKKERNNMSMHNIREQLENVLLKLGLAPKPDKPALIISAKEEEHIPCTEKD